jgi:hypothetical protein
LWKLYVDYYYNSYWVKKDIVFGGSIKEETEEKEDDTIDQDPVIVEVEKSDPVTVEDNAQENVEESAQENA